MIESANTKKRITSGLQSAVMPLFYLLATFAMVVLWDIFSWPTGGVLIEYVRRLFSEYGFWIVLLAAFLEGIVLVNIYVPCSFVIVMGVVLARGNPSGAALSVGITEIGFLLSSFINYALGRYGLAPLISWFSSGDLLLKRAEVWQNRWGAMAIGLAYWHPNFGAFAAVNAGKAKVSFPRFLQWVVPAIVLWNALFGFFFYWVSPKAEEIASSTPILLLQIILVIWSIAAFSTGFARSKE